LTPILENLKPELILESVITALKSSDENTNIIIDDFSYLFRASKVPKSIFIKHIRGRITFRFFTIVGDEG
jgi:hypothetical protein